MPPINLQIQLTDKTRAGLLLVGDAYDVMNRLSQQGGSHFAVGGIDEKGRKLCYIALKEKCSLITIQELDQPSNETVTSSDQ